MDDLFFLADFENLQTKCTFSPRFSSYKSAVVKSGVKKHKKNGHIDCPSVIYDLN